MINKKNFWLSGFFAGLLPHTFCILFVLFSVLGTTVATVFLKPLLLNKDFFYFLIILSFIFAGISALFYLKKNGILSWQGIKRKWRYIGLMYGLTILVNLTLFLFVFPNIANFKRNKTQVLSTKTQMKEIVLRVEIPCSGHAALITEELKKNKGIESVTFSLPNIFRLTYDLSLTNEGEILGQEIFKNFKAVVIK